MNSPSEFPGEPTNERRSVPRHIRDGEHDSWEENVPASSGWPGLQIALWAAVVLAIGVAVWAALR